MLAGDYKFAAVFVSLVFRVLKKSAAQQNQCQRMLLT